MQWKCWITGLVLLASIQAESQIPVLQIIQAGVKRVIVAVDLKIQRLQNKTIWLQNAQKTIENALSQLHLDEIGAWVEKQRSLYAHYFDELRQVKSALLYYRRVKDITSQQIQLVNEYRAAWALFRQDKHFTPDELDYMQGVYQGMMAESVKSLDQLSLVITAFVTQMSDARRLSIIDAVAQSVEEMLMDLKAFNEENKLIALQRATEQADIDYVKRLYGLP
jgi:hypothetical protein